MRTPALSSGVRVCRARAACSSAPVIITGESGTGKERIAQAIHNLSPRSAGPYVAVNCAAIPETLIESELFGHERGAFTGAERSYEGCFKRASGGTPHLDEFIEMRPDMQAKLLRVLEERKVKLLGASREVAVDVRVLAATNRPLEDAISEGLLRQDLFYRLSVFVLKLPPLRERIEELPALVADFIREANQEQRRQVEGVSAECLEALKAHRWPGNVRELRNVIDHAVIVIYDGDDFHSQANKEKMTLGIALTDADRLPWLTKIRELIANLLAEHASAVIACSALKKSYRDWIMIDPASVKLVYLKGSLEMINARLGTRTGHFMNKALLRSQFDALEEPHDAVMVDASRSPGEIVAEIRKALGI
jgi:carbohydrate kinase (thermoresistant glucokinase family)